MVYGFLLIFVSCVVVIVLIRWLTTRLSRNRHAAAAARIQRLIDESRTSPEAVRELELELIERLARIVNRRLRPEVRPYFSTHLCASLCAPFFADRNRIREIETPEEFFQDFVSFLKATVIEEACHRRRVVARKHW
jgi:hypothetical protein